MSWAQANLDCATLQQIAMGAPLPPSSSPLSSSGPSPICTDRPTKSDYACTVDAGHFQYESDGLNGSFLRLDGVTTDTWLVTNPTLKLGLTSNIDVEANLAPLEVVRTHDKFGDGRSVAGVGDLYLRVKFDVFNAYGGNLQAALLPYLKAPTARPGIGDGAVEGGGMAPLNYKISSTIVLTTTPEIDVYKDSKGDGRHVNTIQLINVGVSLPHNFTVYGEFWGDWNFDPAGMVRQYSADCAIAYSVNALMQLDAGLNFGLNRSTPGVQAYFGVSQKF